MQKGTLFQIAAAQGDSSTTAPAEYVASLFDDYAARFDEHLVKPADPDTFTSLLDDVGHYWMGRNTAPASSGDTGTKAVGGA